MAMRRPRLKAAVNLAPRRAPNAVASATVSKPNPVKEEPGVSAALKPAPAAEISEQVADPSDLNVRPASPNETASNPDTIPVQNPIPDDDAPKEPVAKPSARRIIKPSVCLPIRKRKPPTQCTPGPAPENVAKTEPIPVSLISVIVNVVENQPDAKNTEPTKPDPPQFKPPPSINMNQQPKRTDVFVHNPFANAAADENRISDQIDDISAPPQSPNKVRQRIRPTPCFALHRRNSMNQGGNESESDAEYQTTKRQRLISSSSTHSALVGQPHAPFRGSAVPNRMRTESVCSNLSDVMSIRDLGSKPKKVARSEEFQRIVQAKRDFSTRFQGNKPDKARLTMFDMIFYNPSTNPMKNPAVKSRRPSTSSSASAQSIKGRRSSTTSSVVSAVSKLSSIGSSSKSIKVEKNEDEETMMPVPQLKLGPNGEIILDEKSLVIETTGDKEARETLANADIVYDDEFSGTSGFYKRSKRTRDWPPDETIRFYRCLHTIGTDFSLMLSLFPNRTRRDMKLKFKKEERNNPTLINKALLHPKLFDIDELKKDFAEEEAEIQRLRTKWEEDKRMLADAKKNVLKETGKKHRMSTAMREISAGDEIYQLAETNAKLTKRKRQIKTKLEPVTIPDVPPVYKLSNKEALNSNSNSTHLDEWISTITPSEEQSGDQTFSEHQINYDNSANFIDVNNIPIEPHHQISVDDMPLSCKADLFSDQFVDDAIKHPLKLDEQDILNMEIIFESVTDLDESLTKQKLLIPENFQIASIHSITDGKNVAMNPIYLNKTKDFEDTPVSIVKDTKIMGQPSSSNSCESNELSTESGVSHGPDFEEDGNQNTMDSIMSNGDKDTNFKNNLHMRSMDRHQHDESANLSPAEHVPDIDLLEHYDSDASQSHLSPFSSTQSLTSHHNEDEQSNYKFNEPKTDTEPITSGESSTPQPTTVPIIEPEANDEEDDDDDEDLSNLADSLVVVSRKDADGNIVHEVFLKSPTTGCLSEEPLDLPAEVIERIKMSLMA